MNFVIFWVGHRCKTFGAWCSFAVVWNNGKALLLHVQKQSFHAVGKLHLQVDILVHLIQIWINICLHGVTKSNAACRTTLLPHSALLLGLHTWDMKFLTCDAFSLEKVLVYKGPSINHVTQKSRSTLPPPWRFRDASFTFSYLQMKICFSLYKPVTFHK